MNCAIPRYSSVFCIQLPNPAGPGAGDSMVRCMECLRVGITARRRRGVLLELGHSHTRIQCSHSLACTRRPGQEQPLWLWQCQSFKPRAGVQGVGGGDPQPTPCCHAQQCLRTLHHPPGSGQPCAGVQRRPSSCKGTPAGHMGTGKQGRRRTQGEPGMVFRLDTWAMALLSLRIALHLSRTVTAEGTQVSQHSSSRFWVL